MSIVMNRRSHAIGPEQTNYGDFSAVREIIRIIWPQRARIAIGLITSIFVVALALLQPLVAGDVVAHVSQPSAFAAYITILVGLLIAHSITEAISGYLLEVAGERVTRDLRRDFARHLLALPLRTIEKMRLGDLISRATSDTTLVKNLASQSLVRLSTGMLGATGGALLMFHVDRVLTIVALSTMAIAAVVLTVIAPRIQKIAIRSQESVGIITSDLERALSEIRTVKANQTEEFEVKRITKSIDGVFRHNRDGARLVSIGSPLIRLATTGSLVVVLIVGGTQVSSGEVPPDHLVTIMLYAIYIAGPVSDVFESVSEIQRETGALRRISEVERLSVEPVYVTAVENDPIIGKRLMSTSSNRESGVSEGLQFESVRFSYPGGNSRVLDGVSFSVNIGEHAGLVGVSGSGKSTIFSLACRLYEPQAGTIRIAGSDLRKISLYEARSLVGLVDQHAPILFGSLRENLRYGNEAISDDDINEIVEIVSLGDLVRSLPRGLDSQVGEHGSLLSGGERQRIALGRALLGKPFVLLLDEPTAMLDSNAEESLIEVLSEVKKSCAILTISHKMSTLVACDTLWKLEHGRISLSTPASP